MDEGRDSRPHDVRASTGLGLRWLGAARVVQFVLQWGFQVLLARLLFPEDFGLMAAAMILAGILVLLSDMGLEAALVQLPRPTPALLVAARRLSLWAAGILFLAGGAGGFLMARALEMEALRLLVPVLSLTVLLTPLAIVPRSLLLREMRFKRLALVDLVAVAGGGVVSVGLALLGGGVWSLALGVVAQAALQTAFYRGLRPWTPPVGVDGDAAGARRLGLFGLTVVATGSVNYLQAHVDYFAVGAWLGEAALGYYSLAFNLMTHPTRQLAMVLSRIALPATASLQDQPERLARGYALLSRYIALATFPAMAGLILVAPEFITVVYGSRWAPSVLPLQILCAAGWVGALSNPASSVLHGIGRPGLNLQINLILLVLVALGSFVAAPHGVAAVAWAIAGARFLLFPVVQGVVMRCTGLRLTAYLEALRPAFLGTLVMAALLVAARLWLVPELPAPARLVTLIGGGLLVYPAYLWVFHRAVVSEGIRRVTGRDLPEAGS